MTLTKKILIGSIIVTLFGNLPADEPQIVQSMVWQKVTDNLNFPEGPAWDGENNLYFSNCYGGWIGRTDSVHTERFLSATTDSTGFLKTNGLAFFHGRLYACDMERKQILKIAPGGQVEVYAAGFNGNRFNRPNDLAFDRQGNLYFTDPVSYDCAKPDGRVYRVSINDKTVTIVQDNMAFSNGIAFSPDFKYLYVAESACERVDRFKVLPDGRLAEKEVFIHLPGGDPDGLAFDVHGNLYIAHFGGGTVYIVNPQGVIVRKILAPGLKPSNLEFGGRDLKTLYLTEDETNALYCLPVEIPGLTLPE